MYFAEANIENTCLRLNMENAFGAGIKVAISGPVFGPIMIPPLVHCRPVSSRSISSSIYIDRQCLLQPRVKGQILFPRKALEAGSGPESGGAGNSTGKPKACPCLSQPCSWYRKKHQPQGFLPRTSPGPSQQPRHRNTTGDSTSTRHAGRRGGTQAPDSA